MPNRYEILALDTETTGTSAKDQVIQLAYISLPNNITEIRKGFSEHKLKNFPIFSEYYCPNVPINPMAYEVHKLSENFLKNGDFRSASEVELPKTTRIIIAHNAPFDFRMLGKPKGVLCICTIKLCKEIEKIRGESFETSDYKLGTLFKHFYPELFEQYNEHKHNAIVDTYMATLILVKLLEKFPFVKTIDEVYETFFMQSKKEK